MNAVFKSITSIVMFFSWIAGIVLASGFWSTFFAVIFPFWSYYLLIEKLLIINGFL
jgi:hypothetical protein